MCIGVYANFQAKQTALTFSAQIYPKMDLGLTSQKTIVGIRISIFEILCVPIFSKTDNVDFLGPNLPKNGFWGRNFKNLSLDSESTPPIYHVSIFSQNGQLLIVWPKFGEIAQLRAILWFKYC